MFTPRTCVSLPKYLALLRVTVPGRTGAVCMCLSRTSTVMTSDPQLRLTLRKGNCVNKTPSTTRDPTYAREHFNNYARMPYILRTSNTSTAPTAVKRILRGDDWQPRATKKHPHEKHPTSAKNELRKSRPRADTSKTRAETGKCETQTRTDQSNVGEQRVPNE